MKAFRTTAQKPKSDGVGICKACKGTGSKSIRVKGQKRRAHQTCIECRGTGKSSSGYMTK